MKTTNLPLTFTMNTNTITKSVVAASALMALGFVGLTEIHADCLVLLGKVVSFGAAVVILAMAASDNGRTKRLS